LLNLTTLLVWLVEKFACDKCNNVFSDGILVRGAIEEIKDSKGIYNKCLLGDAIPGNDKHYCDTCVKGVLLGFI
jgi:hypothetical protein